MATMGRYCKAYSVEQLRTFAGWTEKLENLAPLENEEDGTTQPRTTLAADDYLFLQENYVVTDGIFLDEHVIFDAATPEWQEFCTKELAFEIPDYKRFEETQPVAADPAAAEAAQVATAAGQPVGVGEPAAT
jgi:hypothetical protein